MKILVCTDGSQESLNAIEEACKIADGCKVNEVSVISVDDGRSYLPIGNWSNVDHPTKEDVETFLRTREVAKEKIKRDLLEATRIFQQKNIAVNTILKYGSPSENIVQVAQEERFDLIVLGRRGISGMKKLFLGSVSNAVLQEATTSVLIVK